MKPASILLTILSVIILGACENSTEPEEDYIRPSFRQPIEGEVITDSFYVVMVDVEKNCGCASTAEFYIDDTLVYTDIIPTFDYLLTATEWPGEHTIKVRAEVPGKAVGWDSVRVTIDL
jgi:hypothetical protein